MPEQRGFVDDVFVPGPSMPQRPPLESDAGPARAGELSAAQCQATHDVDAQVRALQLRLAQTEKELAEQEYRLRYLTNLASYRLAAWLRATPFWNLLRWLKSRNRGVAVVRALGQRGERAQSCDVLLLAARPAPAARAVPWEGVELVDTRQWTLERRPEAPYGRALSTTAGMLRVPLYGEDPVLTFLQGPRSGKVEVEYDGSRRVFDLYAPEAAAAEIRLRDISNPDAWPPTRVDVRAQSVDAGNGPNLVPRAPSALDGLMAGEPCTGPERRWVEETRGKGVPVLAIHTPRWVGVSASTRTLFEHCYPFPACPDVEPYGVKPAECRRQAALIAASGVKHVVFSGGDEIHHQLARELKRLDGDIRCDLLWHGSQVQFVEDYTWRVIKLWIEAAREGLIHTIGTVKKGMEEFFERLGCRSRFVINYVPEVPAGPSVPDAGGPYLGLWSSGHSPWKPPYPMLAAAKLVPGATIRASNLGTRGAEVVDFIELRNDMRVDRALSRDELRDAMRRTHLTLYVTFSECSPMLPLESLSVGTPCLIGPTSHLFEDETYLHDRLVVPYPDRADVIARYIRRALDEREDIVRRYIQYAPGYNDRARASVREFLGR